MTRARRIAAEAAGTAFLAQLAGAFAGVAAATVLFRWLAPWLPKDAEAVVISHPIKQRAAYER